MSITSCIQHPKNTCYVQLHDWQVEFCQYNHCAALLLSYFIASHDWRLTNKQYYNHFNNIAKTSGNDQVYLFFTTNDLINGCMGFCEQGEISEGLELLADLGAISVHNLNSGHYIDSVKCFQFYPDVCNQWLVNRYGANANVNNLLNNKQAITIRDDSGDVLSHKYNGTSSKIADVMDLLVDKGFPTDKIKFPEEFDCINKLLNQGAQLLHFDVAYDLAVKKATHCNLNIYNLLNIVVDIMG